jgi:hypothetical protein
VVGVVATTAGVVCTVATDVDSAGTGPTVNVTDVDLTTPGTFAGG